MENNNLFSSWYRDHKNLMINFHCLFLEEYIVKNKYITNCEGCQFIPEIAKRGS